MKLIKQHPILITVLLLLIIPFGLGITKQSQRESPYQSIENPTPFISPIPSPSSTSGRVSGQIIIKFKQSIPQATVQQELQKYNASILSTNDSIHISTVQVPQGQEDMIIQALTDSGFVEYAEPNYTQEYRFTPNDEQFSQQWNLEKIQAEKAWDITKGAGVIIAIIDGGVDRKHQDLNAKIGATNPANITDTSKGHGTHVSGIAAGATDNATGIAGICPQCRLLVGQNGGNSSTAANSITWAVDQGAKVISMSWGGSNASKALEDAINYAWNNGALPVAAVPNENINMDNIQDYPSGYTNVIPVTNTNIDDQLFSSAGYGKVKVWVGAPGTNILSTVPSNKYGAKTGTSMATPLVAGVAGLVWSTSYGTSPDAVRNRICQTADKITGTGTKFKCGRLNAFAAVSGGAPKLSPSAAATPSITPTPIVVAPRVTVQPPTPAPTFVAIADCKTNNSCPTPEPTTPTNVGVVTQVPDEPEPTEETPTENLPIQEDPSDNLPGPSDNQVPNNSGGLLQTLMQVIQLLLKLLSSGQ